MPYDQIARIKGERWKKYFTTKELCTLLGIDESHLYKRLKKGVIPQPEVVLGNGTKLWSPTQAKEINRTHMQPGMYRRGRQPTVQVELPEFGLEQFNRARLDKYWGFICERMNIYWRRKEGQQPPWTEDPVLAREFITNMYRELDPATIYLNENILSHGSLSKLNKIFNVMFFRFIGSQERTHRWVGNLHFGDLGKEYVVQRLESIEVPFGDAYTVYANVADPSISKIKNVANLFEDIALDFQENLGDDILCSQSAQEAYEAIKRYPGFGPFISFQVMIDLLYKNKHGKQILPFNLNDFVVAGPGAQKGLGILLKDGYSKRTEQQAIRWLHENQQAEMRRGGYAMRWLDHPLWLSDIQNTLCEWSKYWRCLQNGNQRSTRRYRIG